MPSTSGQRVSRPVAHAGRVAAAALVVAMLTAAGCGTEARSADSPAADGTIEPRPLTAAAPTTRPADTRPIEPPLPDEALVALDELEPEVPVPSNPPGAFELPERVEPLVREAEQMIAERDFAGAVARLERAVGFDPDNARIRKDLGLTYAGLANLGKALDNFRRTVKIAPADAQTQFMLGRLLAGQGRDADAIVALRTALKSPTADPAKATTAETLVWLGRLLEKQGYYTAALECYRRLGKWIDEHGREYVESETLRPLVLAPERLLSQRGLMLIRLRRHDRAAEVLRHAYELNRGDPRIVALLIEAHIGGRRYDRAERLLVEMANETTRPGAVGEIATRLVEAGGDPKMPRRIWEAVDPASRPTLGPLAGALADAAADLGAIDEAGAILESLLKVMPGNVSAARNLARMYAEQNRPGEALTLLADVLAADPDATTAVRQGVREIVRSDLPEGFPRRFARRARAGDDEHAYAVQYVAGELAAERGMDLLAAELYDLATESNPGFIPPYRRLLDIHIGRRRLDRAEQIVEVVRDLPGDAEAYFVYYALGRIALARGDVAEAVNQLELAKAADNEFVPALLLLADMYLRADRAPQAMRTLLAAMNAEPDNAEVYERLFRFYTAAEQPERAEEVARRLLERNPGSIPARVMLAELAIRSGDENRAREIIGELRDAGASDTQMLRLELQLRLSREEPLSEEEFESYLARLTDAVRADPNDDTAVILLSVLLAQRENPEEATAIWARLHKTAPDNRLIMQQYVAALDEADQSDRAIAELERLHERLPDDVWIRDALRQLLVREEQYDRALEYVRSWMEQADTEAQRRALQVDLLVVLTMAERWDEALPVVDELIATETLPAREVRFRNQKMAMLLQAEHFDEAVEVGREWVRLRPQSVQARRLVIDALVLSGEPQKAARQAEQWLADFPADAAPAERAELLSRQSTALEAAGDRQGAVNALEQALTLTPDEADANNNLGYTLADMGVELARAERLIRKALAAEPDSLAIRDSLGWVLYKQGRFGEARRVFDRLLANVEETGRPADPVILDHAGDTHYRLGDVTRAVALWTRALKAARERKLPAAPTREILRTVPAKIEAITDERAPDVAPVGETEPEATTRPATRPTTVPATRPVAGTRPATEPATRPAARTRPATQPTTPRPSGRTQPTKR